MIEKIFFKLNFLPRVITAKRLGLKQVPPNYTFIDCFKQNDVAIDIGVGNDPNFSKYLINRYNIECFAVDPTRKHKYILQQLENEIELFHFLPYALGSENKTVTFFESQINISGSLLDSHRNVINDPIISYNVDMISLDKLLKIIGEKPIAIMKVDIEGAEYQLIKNLKKTTLEQIRQLIVEFHHSIVRDYTWRDTQEAIKRIQSFGMKSFVYNGRDCLFYWEK